MKKRRFDEEEEEEEEYVSSEEEGAGRDHPGRAGVQPGGAEGPQGRAFKARRGVVLSDDEDPVS